MWIQLNYEEVVKNQKKWINLKPKKQLAKKIKY